MLSYIRDYSYFGKVQKKEYKTKTRFSKSKAFSLGDKIKTPSENNKWAIMWSATRKAQKSHCSPWVSLTPAPLLFPAFLLPLLTAKR